MLLLLLDTATTLAPKSTIGKMRSTVEVMISEGHIPKAAVVVGAAVAGRCCCCCVGAVVPTVVPR